MAVFFYLFLSVLSVSLVLLPICSSSNEYFTPFVLCTWDYPEAVKEAWKQVSYEEHTALDGVEHGINVCELTQCRGSVGFGNHPDENGEPTLDALIMDGPSHNAGAVGCIRKVKKAISVARKVLENTDHTLMVGSLATDFAEKMGFTIESLTTNTSDSVFNQWKDESCQPNYWKNVSPDPKRSCGPYKPSSLVQGSRRRADRGNHDTIGMIVMDKNGYLSVGTSTNGLNHKIPGRVGDRPVVGSGGYVDQDVGAAAATGDGDVMMRFLPSYQAVESMKNGLSPQEAAMDAISRIARKYPNFEGAIIVANLTGHFGIACAGFDEFPYTFASNDHPNETINTIRCT